jgi:tetratricopeptide (TPR) repeat protein
VRILALSAAVLAGSASVLAQATPPAADQPPTVQRFFEAGQYKQALQLITTQRQTTPPAPPTAISPADAYLAAQVYMALRQVEPAKQEFGRLVASEDPVWQLVGESAIALVNGGVDLALQKANEADAMLAAGPAMTTPTDGTKPVVARATEKFHAAYQMGFVKARREDWQGAAQAFTRAAELNPTFAYAQYYAGLMYSRVSRPDLQALYFDRFLSLAPAAPERQAVMSMLRTIRGN